MDVSIDRSLRAHTRTCTLCLPATASAGAEIPFVFHTTRFIKTPPELRLADTVTRYWRNFAYSGDPNVAPPTAAADPKTAALPKWPRYDNETDSVLELGTGPDGKVGVLAGVKKDDCVMWDECETDPSCWGFDPEPPFAF